MLSSVEARLIQARIDAIDSILENGLTNLNWKSHSIDEFITQAMSMVGEAYHIAESMKNYMTYSQDILQSWIDNPMIQRKTMRTYLPAEFLKLQIAAIEQGYAHIKDGGRKIHEYLVKCQGMVGANKGSASFKAYLESVDKIVVEGLRRAILASLTYLHQQIDSENLLRNDINPLLEIQLLLENNQLVFQPPISTTDEKRGVRDIVFSWVNKFQNIGTLIQRIDHNSEFEDYDTELHDDAFLRKILKQIENSLATNESDCDDFRLSFNEFSFLWTIAPSDALKSFLEYESESSDSIPSVSSFEREIFKYRQIEEEIRFLPGSQVVGWLKIDTRPLRQTLLNLIASWRSAFQDYPLKFVERSITEMLQFISDTSSNLDSDVYEFNSLVNVLKSLRDIKLVEAKFTSRLNMMLPMLQMLSKHGRNIPFELIQDAEGLKMKWIELKNKGGLVKDKNSDLIRKESSSLQTKIKEMTKKVERFRSFFLHHIPNSFQDDYASAFAQLDELISDSKNSIHVNLKERERLLLLQELFEIDIQDFPLLLDCLKDAKMVKTLLDINSLLVNTLKHWKKQRWFDVDPKLMERDMVEVDSILKNLNQEAQHWKLCKEMFKVLEELRITVPILESLQSEHIKTRHWKQIMRATGVSFVIDNKFVLEELLKLNLHLYKDEILRIVVQSSQEHEIEKQLKRIENYFDQLKIERLDKNEPFRLQLDPAIYSSLDENLNILHTLASSAYVSFNQYLQEAIHSLLDKLGFVERFSEQWQIVTAKWQSLEGIYSKFKLNDDVDDYNSVSSEWKNYLSSFYLDFTSMHPGRQKIAIELQNFIHKFEKFEKVLEALLNDRRKIHPMLYFISDKDLIKLLTLDEHVQNLSVYVNMLSEGIHTLSVRSGSDQSVQVSGVISKAGEVLAFPEALPLSKEHDVNISNIIEHARKIVENRIYNTYVECQHRDKLAIFRSSCMQEMLHVVTIGFTEQVSQALERCEKLELSADVLGKLKSKLQAEHQQTVDFSKNELSEIERKKHSCLFIAEFAHIEIMEKLVQENTSSKNSFEWQSQKRMYMNFETCRSYGEIFDLKKEYAHEFLGTLERVVVTPMTQRCQISMANAASLLQIGALIGPRGIGKQAALQDMAMFFGLMLRSKAHFGDVKDVLDTVNATSITKTWALFEVSLLDTADELILYSTIKETLLCFKKHIICNRTIDDSARQRTSSSPIYSVQPLFFFAVNVDKLDYIWHPSNKGDLRACNVFQVHLDIIISTTLQSLGFENHVILTKQICKFKEIFESLLATSLSTTTLKALILKAKKSMSQGSIQDEISALAMAVKDSLSQSFDLEDSVIEQLIKNVFGGRSLATASDDNVSINRDFDSKIMYLEQAVQEYRSVFIVGPTNSGKTSLINSHIESKIKSGKKVNHLCVNPKAMETSHMLGYFHNGTWIEGVISCAFKEFEEDNLHDVKIMVFDSTMDPQWTEMLKPLIDTHRFFKSNNGECMAINPDTKIFFETPDLQICAPCFLGKGYVSFVGDDCVPWKTLIQAWLSTSSHRQLLQDISEFYMPKIVTFLEESSEIITMYHLKSRIKGLVEIFDLILQLNAQKLDREEQRPEQSKSLESVFIFSCIWAFFGCFDSNTAANFRKKANSFWKEKYDRIPLPGNLTIFEICFDFEKREFVPWQSQLSGYYDISQSHFGQLFVPTQETVPYSYLTSILASWNKFVLLKGKSGCGKTSLIRETIRMLDQEVFATEYLLFQCTTSAHTLQQKFQGMLSRSTKQFWYPMSGKKLIFQIDDMNLCERDQFGSQNACEFLRYFIENRRFYERTSSNCVHVKDLMLVGSFTPYPGFTLNQRLENKFISFTIDSPSDNALHTIFNTLALNHFDSFEPRIKTFISEAMVWATINVHHTANESFKAAGERFHYVYSLRDICAVMEGMSRASTRFFKTTSALISLWIHECERVYSDRFVSRSDFQFFKKKLNDTCIKWFDEYEDDINQIVSKDNHYAPLILQGSEQDQKTYSMILDMDKVKGVVAERHLEFQAASKLAPLVTLTDSLSHITRLARALTQQSSHVVLLGAHGSETKHLLAITAFILGVDLISGKGTYEDFWQTCKTCHERAGVHSGESLILLEETDLIDLKKVALTQEIIETGTASSFFDQVYKEDICRQVKPKLDDSGIIDNADNCWEYYLREVRRNLHFGLCFANDSEFREISVRHFPSLYQGMVINFYHPLVKENLVEMAETYLSDEALVPYHLKDICAQYLAFVFDFVRISHMSLSSHLDKSPSGFLDYVHEFQSLLRRKHDESIRQKSRIQSVLHKLEKATEQAKYLEQKLQDYLRDLSEKDKVAEQYLQSLRQETSVIDAEKASAAEHEEEFVAINSEFEKLQNQYLEEHKAVDPFVSELENSLTLIDKKSLTELKSLNIPPSGVEDVLVAVTIIINKGTIPKDFGWNSSKKVIANSEQLLKALHTINGENVSDTAIAYCEHNFLRKDTFIPDKMRNKSLAASGLCAWIINLCKYKKAYQTVIPTRRKLDEAANMLHMFEEKMANVHSRLQALDNKLNHLTTLYQAALAEKNKAQDVVNETRSKIDVAKKMMDILNVQNDRWNKDIQKIESNDHLLFGDTLLCASFLSFMGVCNRLQREEIVSSWKLDLTERDIAVSKDFSITSNLISEVEVDQWHLEELPRDSLVLENAVLIVHSLRAPAIIDPDDVFLPWLQNHFRLHGQSESEENPGSEAVCCSCHEKDLTEKIDIAVMSNKVIIVRDLLHDIPDPLIAILQEKSKKIYLHTRLENPRFVKEHPELLTVIDCRLDSRAFQSNLQLVVNRELDLDNYRKIQDKKKEQLDLRGKRQSCENELLDLIANATGDVLGDDSFLVNLEQCWSKYQSAIEEYDRSTLHQDEIRLPADYDQIADRGVLMYKLVKKLVELDDSYKVSTPQLVTAFLRGLQSADEKEKPDPESRLQHLILATTLEMSRFVVAGLSKTHRLSFLASIVLEVLAATDFKVSHCKNFLLSKQSRRGRGEMSPFPWLDDSAWSQLSALEDFALPSQTASSSVITRPFVGFKQELLRSSGRFREWYLSDSPENASLPGDWRQLDTLLMILVVSILRPDRMQHAFQQLVGKTLGLGSLSAIFNSDELVREYGDRKQPIFFIVHEDDDVDVLVQNALKSAGPLSDRHKFKSMSLADVSGDDVDNFLANEIQEGDTAHLQDVHVAAEWLNSGLPRFLACAGQGHLQCTLILSGRRAAISEIISDTCLKLDRTGPKSLHSRLMTNLDCVNNMLELEQLSPSSRRMIFALCVFYAVINFRKNFQSIGWNHRYSFTVDSLVVACQYASDVSEMFAINPWRQVRRFLRHLACGEELSDALDESVLNTHCESFVSEQLLSSMEIIPGLRNPGGKYQWSEVTAQLEKEDIQDCPTSIGLFKHAGLQCSFGESEDFLHSILTLQEETPRSSNSEEALTIADELLDKIPEPISLEQQTASDALSFFFYNEVDRLNRLLARMMNDLSCWREGLKQQQLSAEDSALMASLTHKVVPRSWLSVSFPSLRCLADWLENVKQRQAQLRDIAGSDLQPQRTIWLAGLFCPQVFMHVVAVSLAEAKGMAAEDTDIETSILSGQSESDPAFDGEAFHVCGLFLEGARWNEQECRLDIASEYHTSCNRLARAALSSRKDKSKAALCLPAYRTRRRGGSFLFNMLFSTNEMSAAWLVSGAAIVLDVEDSARR
eukprot:767948-Hanusia_phi.AAC.10